MGQTQDFTAIAVVERAELTGDWDPAVFAWKKTVRLRLRHLERVALGTPYPEVVEDLVLAVLGLVADLPGLLPAAAVGRQELLGGDGFPTAGDAQSQ